MFCSAKIRNVKEQVEPTDNFIAHLPAYGPFEKFIKFPIDQFKIPEPFDTCKNVVTK